MQKPITYTIDGDPIALARARFGEHRVYDSQKQLKLVVGMQIAKQHNDQPLYSGPLKLNVTFFLPLPKKFPNHLPGSYHTYRPDLSNLLKFIEDVATGILYKDDCLICSVETSKRYDHIPRTEFTITNLKAKP